jgi:pyrimidine deaminase RibD-like protein
MNEITIVFDQPLSFLGRNGVFKMTAIQIWRNSMDNSIWLEPITSKNRTGKCWQQIPNNKIDEVIVALQKMKV